MSFADVRADFVILDRDLMQVPAEAVLQVKPMQTYASGVKVF